MTVTTILNFIIENTIQNKKYGNYAADSAAKFFHEKNDAADSTACFHSGGAAWGPWAQAPPGIKRMRKTKPMAMAMLVPILSGTFWYFFSNGLAPSSLAPFSFFRIC